MTRQTRVGVAEGAVVLTSLLCVPVALVAAIHAPVTGTVAPVVLGLVGAAALSWSVVTVGLARLVAHQVRGDGAVVESGPMGWAAVRVAALVLCIAPFLEHVGHPSSPTRGSNGAVAPRTALAAFIDGGRAPRGEPLYAVLPARAAPETPQGAPNEHVARGVHRCRPSVPSPVSLGSGAILLPLAAEVRRRARQARRTVLEGDRAVDVETALLGLRAPFTPLLACVARSLAAADLLGGCAHVVVAGGEAWLDDGTWRYDPDDAQRDVRCLVVVLGEERGRTHVVLAPRGALLALGGVGAESLVDDAVRVGTALGLGRPVRTASTQLLHALAIREDDDVLVCEGDPREVASELRDRCIIVMGDDEGAPTIAEVGVGEVRLPDGRVLERSSLDPMVRSLLDGQHDRGVPARVAATDAELDDRGVVVRLLTAVPRVDGLVAPLESSRERRAVELLAYLALRSGEPVTGERLRVRVLGTPATDAAAKTLFNVASCLRRSLGEGPFGPRLPAAGRSGHYAVASDVHCDVAVLEARVAQAGQCEEREEKMAWLRAALELIESEPFSTVLEGYDWFLSEGHVARLQIACEDAAFELVELAVADGLVELAAFALDRATLVDPHSERLAAGAMRVAAARQASFEAMAPAARSTAPSAPAAV